MIAVNINQCVCSRTSCCLAQAEKQMEISTHLGPLGQQMVLFLSC